ncbi:hypothetical protein HPB51_017160 [Rhipicephalus microplus]|uniref:Uncharacterized protein n=1 Tax=Rhipicephalus microplus TaxID=6941 RepID=A0A9J6DP42_RHIMP|nr:protein transport protein sec31-like [Rhipicephalus microplus]KAH8023790.1 hypothetical protein HPB51_017160 [Rhipicephalus microplus]
MAAPRPGSASGSKKPPPRAIQIAIEVEPEADGSGESFTDSSTEEVTEEVVVTRLVPRDGRRSPPRRSSSPSRAPRRPGGITEVVISASDENFDGRRSPCRVHGGYSYGPAGMPAPRIPRSGHKATCRHVTACTVPAMGPMMLPQPMYGAIGSAKGTRMEWKLFPDGTLNITMGPPLKTEDDDKAAKPTVAAADSPPASPDAVAPKDTAGAAPATAPGAGAPDTNAPPPAAKPIGSNMSLARIMTAGFMRPRLPVVFEAVIGPRPGLTPALLKPPPGQESASDTQISVVSRFECTCPPPPSPPPPKNEHAHCQELLLELLDRQEQVAAQLPQINLITPVTAPPPQRPPRREPHLAPMCQREWRAMRIMEMAASADDAVVEEDRRRPTPLLHIMEKEYDDHDYE